MSAGVIASHYVSVVSYDSTVLADSPLFYLKLDEGSGTTANDSSGNARHFTINGSPTMTAAAVLPSGSRSITIDTLSKYITISAASWMSTSTFTAECWVRFSNITSDYHGVMSRDGDSSHRAFTMYVNPSGHLDAYDVNAGSDKNGTATLSIGTAYHLVTTYDGAATSMYVNGVSDGGYTQWFNNVTTVNDFFVGMALAGNVSPSYTLIGDISHAAFYGTALSSTRVAAHYAAR